MRQHFPAALAALALGACGGPGRADGAVRQVQTLELPLAAPDGSQPLVADFIEVCSAAMDDTVKGAAALSRRAGWSVSRSEAAGMAIAGVLVAEHEATGAQLQIIPGDYPHLAVVSCQMNAFPRSGGPEPADLSLEAFAALDGFLGGVRTVAMPGEEGMTVARYSGVAANGDIILLGGNLTGSLDMLFMGRSSERIPETPDDT